MPTEVGARRTLGRRAALRRLAAGAGLGLAACLAREQDGARSPALAQGVDPASGRFPALDLRIATPSDGAVLVVDLRRDFGAAGDGVQDDGPALMALAEAVNAGQVPAGAVAYLPPGVYRVVGDESVTFRRPVVLRGAGPAETVIRIEYTAQGSTFLRAVGDGQYVMHTAGVYSSGPGRHRYPDAPYAAVLDVPRRGDTAVAVDRPDLFAPGDQVYLLCDDDGAEIEYAPSNRRYERFLLKQHLRVQDLDRARVALDTPLRHDFAGDAPRLYRWRPLSGFGLEHLAIDDRSDIPDTEATNTFRAVRFDGVVDGWVWDVHFRDNTSIPLSISRSRRIVVCESLFDRARHVGGGGNGYLPELYLTDDSLVEYCTSVDGRHALICNWSCWGNVFRYNRVVGTPNIETHGEYSVENLYLRNDAGGSRLEIGGGGTRVHAHDGPYHELRENHARELRVLKPLDRDNRLLGNWHVAPIADAGVATVIEGNQTVPAAWDAFPFKAYCGHDHTMTSEISRPS